MICALCRQREANKKNTHYLTDGIIRSCLNLDGSKDREKGFYFDLSNDSAFVEFNFQRGTAIDKLEEALGRQVNEEEIEKAKKIPFSVDNVFCNVCESLFTEIESKFIADILPRFRSVNLSGINKMNLPEVGLIRLFFYLQVWRTAVCEKMFSIPESTLERLRQIILNYKILSDNEINDFPLSITYLETTGGDYQYTTNYVGFTSDKNPNIIFMNDFSVQFFDSVDNIKFLNFHGLNSETDYSEYVNCKEETFNVKILNDAQRRELLHELIVAEKVKQTMRFYKSSFVKLWLMLFGMLPPQQVTNEYLQMLIGDGDFHVLKFTRGYVVEMTNNFVLSKIRI